MSEEKKLSWDQLKGRISEDVCMICQLDIVSLVCNGHNIMTCTYCNSVYLCENCDSLDYNERFQQAWLACSRDRFTFQHERERPCLSRCTDPKNRYSWDKMRRNLPLMNLIKSVAIAFGKEIAVLPSDEVTKRLTLDELLGSHPPVPYRDDDNNERPAGRDRGNVRNVRRRVGDPAREVVILDANPAREVIILDANPARGGGDREGAAGGNHGLSNVYAYPGNTTWATLPQNDRRRRRPDDHNPP